MSLPAFSTQAQLFSTAGLSGSLFSPTDRYRLLARLVYPKLASARGTLEKCYCADNGRVALEPVLMLGVSILQELDGVPDRQAVEMLRYHAGWNFALNRQIGDEVFHSTSLVNFRNRLGQHQQGALAFTTILMALQEAGLISRQSRQRLDSTQMFGRVAKMSRLDCVRESLRLGLQELEAIVGAAERPVFWVELWERYVETQVDYRTTVETLGRKLGEAGRDAWQLLEWLGQPAQSPKACGAQVQLLRRVFGEQFEVQPGQPTPRAREKEPLEGATEGSAQLAASVEVAGPVPAALDSPAADASNPGTPVAEGQTEFTAEVLSCLPPVEPKASGQLNSDRVQSPHEPDATYGAKGKGEQKKEHVGYKVQIAETVCEATLNAGEPTRNFIVGIVTHPAYEHDQTGAQKMEQEQAQMGLEKPPVQYVDAAYVSAQKLAHAQAEGRELIGPALPTRQMEGRFAATDFQVNVEERKAICPAAKINTQCSRLVEQSTGKVSYRFEFSTHCHDCSLRCQCLGKDQQHRSLVVGEHHTVLQVRRQEQATAAFKQRMKHRNAIEGTQSELVRAHGLRHARYRGLAKVKLQNYFIGAACNVKRWIRLEAWKLRQGAAALLAAQAGNSKQMI
jgi:transposase